ncbi:hypothetical protein C0Q70_15804 [Pomacea canaliculata]|uniref:Uncharacterized protein n=1 Tax=Pomacea canaliculata TaxID=400727 RepID=A0A2T7NVX0_POMCA|nr:hypothetical protein C0Q70_15804 [Pomacea canaliculata]
MVLAEGKVMGPERSSVPGYGLALGGPDHVTLPSRPSLFTPGRALPTGDMKAPVTGKHFVSLWGSQTRGPRANCGPRNKRVIAGSHYTHDGASSALCLPLYHVFQNYSEVSEVMWISGAEYKVSNHPSNNLDPSCAVCRAARAATIMVPATSSCYTGWTLEYTGILMAGLYAHKVATEFICADSALEWLAGTSHSKERGKMLYSVLSSCRPALCPPYIEGEVLSCCND